MIGVNRPLELLSPAGDMQRLKYALAYGADAVYLAGQQFGMRSGPSNFTFEELKAACDLAHEKGKKIYLTCNTLPRNSEAAQLPDFLKNACRCGVDAFIIADVGTLMLAKKHCPDVPVHISTQAGIVNYETARAFYEMGASRIVTARELSLNEIRDIRDKTPPELEIEAFVHGAMCMSFSGRCILSDYLTNRDANRGDCAQPCRWKYYVMEESRPGRYFPVCEDEKGTYLFNSRDLCMLEHLPELDAAGIDSFKIEGRAKSEYYTAAVTFAYRSALDAYLQNRSADFRLEPWMVQELQKMSHRPYTTGFYFGPMKDGQTLDDGGYIRTWDVAALYASSSDGRVTVCQRNRFFEGDTLEILQPGCRPVQLVVQHLYNENDGEFTSAANKATNRYSFDCGLDLHPFSIFRKVRETL